MFVEHIVTPGVKPMPVGRAVIGYDAALPAPSLGDFPPSFSRFQEEKLRHLPMAGETPIAAENEAPTWVNITLGVLTGSSFFTVTVNTAETNMTGSFFPPTVPALLQVLQGARDPGDFIPSEHLIRLERNKLYHLRFTLGIIDHPMHLHGHAFEVIKSSGATDLVTTNPVRKDVVATKEETIIRFRTDNPGPWYLHCHIDWHLEAGLALIFGERLDETGDGSQVIGKDWDALCPAYDDLSPGRFRS